MKAQFLSLVLLALVYACGSATSNQSAEPAPAQLTELSINVGGMTCEMCVASVEKGIAALPGIDSLKVTLSDSLAYVRFDANQTSPEDIQKAVEGRGYTVKGSL